MKLKKPCIVIFTVATAPLQRIASKNQFTAYPLNSNGRVKFKAVLLKKLLYIPENMAYNTLEL